MVLLLKILFIILVKTNFYTCLTTLYRAHLSNNNVKWFNSFVQNQTSVDIWFETRIINNTIITDFTIDNSNIFNILVANNVKLKVLANNVEEKLKSLGKKKRSIIESKKFSNIVGRYASFNEILNWMRHLTRKYPKLVKIQTIGRTYENRSLVVLKLSDNTIKKSNKKFVFIESGIHAREWLSIATNIYILDKYYETYQKYVLKLIREYKKLDLNARKILQNFEIHFMIILNPDGYEYSRISKNSRFWRKNMKPAGQLFGKSSCLGVDLNRNFDYKWMASGSSSNPCSQTYAGKSPSSEEETQAVVKYILSKAPRWSIYFGLHSYGQFWVTPFSYSAKHIPENFKETCMKAVSVIEKIQTKYNSKYEFGTAAQIIYEAGGCSEDWAKVIGHITHSYVIELKPSYDEAGNDLSMGFDVDEALIIPSSEEIFYGLKEYLFNFDKTTYKKTVELECNRTIQALNELFNNS